MSLPPGFRMRPAQDDDADEVACFSNEESVALIGVPLLSADRLRRRWTAPGVDREQDFAVVEAPDEKLCGYLGIEAAPPFTRVFVIGVVAPAFHGLGLGGALVAEAERRGERFVVLADPAARVVVHAGALADEPRVGALLDSRGYREVRRFELRRVEFATAPDSPHDVEGIGIRELRTEEWPQLYEAHVDAFADHWGEGEDSYEDFRHHLLETPDYDSGLWFGAWDGDELAGYAGSHAESREDPERGYVALLGVRRPYRRRGVGEALLLRSFGALYARGRKGVDLHVDADSLTGATRLYARVGMTAHPRFATWEKELRPAASDDPADD